MKGWRPCLDEEGIPNSFQLALRNQLAGKDVCDSEVLEKGLYEAAIAPHFIKKFYDRPKPYETIEIQALLRQRL